MDRKAHNGMGKPKKKTGSSIIPPFFIIAIIIIAIIWAGMSIMDNTVPVPDTLPPSPGITPVTPVLPISCHGYYYPVPSGGVVFLGEGCLDVSAIVPSGQIISWYQDGHRPGRDHPDARRIVNDARNFSVSPDQYLGYEGEWFIGDTEEIAVVVRDVTLGRGLVSPCVSDTPDYFPQDCPTKEPVIYDTAIGQMINTTNTHDYGILWIILSEPMGFSDGSGDDRTEEESPATRNNRQAFLENYSRPIVDNVRSNGFLVDYVGQAHPVIEVLAPPSFIQELAGQPLVKHIVRPKATREVIREMTQRTADETLNVGIFLTQPEGTVPEPDTPRTEFEVREWYAKNRILYDSHSRPVRSLLEREGVLIDFSGPYPMTALYGDVPVQLLEELNGRPDVELIELTVPARPI